VAGVRITLAGRIAVEIDGMVLDERALPGRQPRVAFSLLVLGRDRPVPRDELAASLWGEDRPATWEPALRGVVTRVRGFVVTSGLGTGDTLRSDAGTYRLHLPIDVEVDLEMAFWRLERAEAALRRGAAAAAVTDAAEARGVLVRPLLSGGDSEWVEARRRELGHLLLRALDVLAEGRLALGQLADAVAAADAALDLDPYREPMYRTLMTAHARAGNPAAGLLAFDRCRRQFADELGFDPSPATQRLHLELLRNEPQKDEAVRSQTRERTNASLERPAQADVPPYVGLRAFGESDADRFFGRDGDVARLLDRLATSRFLAVLGPSGSGKSSLVLAGLLPALRAGALPGADTWSIRVLRPGHHPVAALRSVTVAPQEGRRLLVVVDQLEELFVLATQSERTLFVARLTELASSPDRAAAVVVTMRTDLYSALTDHPRLADLASAHQLLITPLDEVGLAEAIEGPARRGGLELEPSLTRTIVRDVARRPGALPLLQQALLELWRRRRGRTLTLEGYQEAGGVDSAVARWAETVWADLRPDEREVARRLLLRLTRPGVGTEDSRLLVPLHQLATNAAEEALVKRVVERLTAARLLTSTTDQGGLPQVELSHEALFQAWPRLRGWVEEDRAGLAVHHRLTEAALEWERRDRDAALLYRGVLLAEAAAWANRYPAAANPAERAFLEASDAAVQVDAHRRVRRLRATVAGLLVGLTLTGGLAMVASEQAARSDAQARIATARALASAAVANLDVDAERSVLLALEAVEATRSVDGTIAREAEEALHRALISHRTVDRLAHGGRALALAPDGTWIAIAASNGRVVSWGASGVVGEQVEVADAPLEAVAISLDGHLIAAAAGRGGIRVWETGDLPGTLRLEAGEGVTGLAFAPDGRSLAASTTRGVLMWDLDEPSSPPREFRSGWSEADHVVFTPDGERLVSGVTDGTAHVYDLATGAASRLRGHSWAVNRVAVSPDGTLVATASDDGTARTWDLTTGDHRSTFPSLAPVASVAFDPTGDRIALGSTDGTAYVFETASARQLLLLGGHTAPVEDLVFTGDGDHLITTSADGTTRRWHVGIEGGRDWLTAPSANLRYANVAFSTDGRWFAVPDDGVSVTVRDSRTGAVRHHLTGHGAWLVGLTFSPDGRWLVATPADGQFLAHEREMRTVPVWDLRTGELATVLRGHSGVVNGSAFSEDASRLATTSLDGTVRTWEVGTWVPLTSERVGDAAPSGAPVGDHPMGVTFRGGQWVAVVAGDGGEVELWREAELRPMDRLVGHRDRVTSVSFGAGRLVTASHAEGAARIWDLDDGALVVEVTDHDAPLGQAVIDPRGTEVATAGDDGVVRLWAVPSGDERLAYYGHRLIATSAAYSPDGRLLATTSPDGTVALRLRSMDELVEVARSRVTRTLNDSECRRFLARADCAAEAGRDPAARTATSNPLITYSPDDGSSEASS
jgi:WD40 repeat protein/DNA-binding SARP family transcriptional activator